MTLVTPDSVNPGDEITAEAINTPHDQLADAINGNLGDDNISSLSGSKIAAGTISTAKIADSAITYAKTDGKIWWEELGRTTLSVAGDSISVTSLPAKKYLKIILHATGTNIRGALRFNNDSGNNYSYRISDNGGADSTGTAFSYYVIGDSGANAVYIYATTEVVNKASVEKIGIGMTLSKSATGAATAPARRETYAAWTNTADQITRVDALNTSTGDFAIGSELIVLGHD